MFGVLIFALLFAVTAGAATGHVGEAFIGALAFGFVVRLIGGFIGSLFRR